MCCCSRQKKKNWGQCFRYFLSQVKIKATLSQPFLKWEWKHQFCGNFHLAERPGSGASRYSADIPTSASTISMHETRELKPSVQSSSSGHKRALGYRDKYPFMPKSRSPRPLPPPERSYKRKSPGILQIPWLLIIVILHSCFIFNI